ncbi:MAG: hypothetical protein DDT26_01711 [Dehalococcoidia bacterium]|nr:hypothetical protein [Chloroflexota bacterium]
MSNLITQTIKLGLPQGVPGTWFSKIDLFFKKKSSTFGCRVFICAVENGTPNLDSIVENSEVVVSADSISVSTTGVAATTFTFPKLVYLERERRYGIVVAPLGAFPDFELWTAKVGETDLATNIRVSSNPLLEGTYLTRTNSLAWADSANEDIKFTLFRARFNSPSGQIRMRNRRIDLIRPFAETIALSPGIGGIQEGDEVYAWDIDVGRPNPASYGRVLSYDGSLGLLRIVDSTANFTPNQIIAIVRPTTPGSLIQAGQVGVLRISTIENVGYQSFVPRLGFNRQGGAVELTFRGARLTAGVPSLDPTTTRLNSDSEFDFQDVRRILASATNERNSLANAYSVEMTATFTSDGSSFTSPFFTLDQANLVLLRQSINNDATDEHTTNGKALSKYVSRIVELAEGQDAEDLRVFLTAFQPPNTRVMVYAKLQNGEDETVFDEKAWTEMVQTGGVNVFSDPANQRDYRELTYSLPAGAANAPLPGAANGAVFTDSTFTPLPGIATYRSGGHAFRGFKKYSIKIVLLSENAVNTPRLNDMRAIALQL